MINEPDRESEGPHPIVSDRSSVPSLFWVFVVAFGAICVLVFVALMISAIGVDDY